MSPTSNAPVTLAPVPDDDHPSDSGAPWGIPKATEPPPPPDPPKPTRRLWLVVGTSLAILLIGGAFVAAKVMPKPKPVSPTPSLQPSLSAGEQSHVKASTAAGSSYLDVTGLTAQSADLDQLLTKALQVAGSIGLQGNLSASGSASFGGPVKAASFTGDGSGLTAVDAAYLGGEPASYYINISNNLSQVSASLTTLTSKSALLAAPNVFTAPNVFADGLSASSLALTTALPVASGGTGAATLSANGVLVGNDTGPVSSLVAGAANECLVSTTTVPAWTTCPGAGGVMSLDGLTGDLTITGTTGAGTTLTIQDAGTAQKGLAQFNATNFTVNAGVVNTVQNLGVAASPTFAAIHTGSFLPSAGLTFSLPTAAAGSYEICTTSGNCPSTNGTVTVSGSPVAGNIPKFTNATNLAPSLLNDNGTTVSVGGALSVTGATSLAGTVTLSVLNSVGVVQTDASGNLSTGSLNLGTGPVTGTLPVGKGGTGSGTAAGARTNLGAAAAGANADITSTTALNTITPSGALTIGAAAQQFTLQGSATSVITAASGGFTTTLSFTTPTANRALNLPDASGTICLQGATACGFAPATGGTGYIQNQSAAAQTANFFIQSAATTSVTAALRVLTGQTADVLQVQDASGSNTALKFNVASGVSTLTLGDGLIGGTGMGAIKLGTPSAGLYTLQYQSGMGLTLQSPGATNGLGVKSTGASQIDLTLRGTTNQTGDLQELQAANGEVLTKFDANGSLTSYGTNNQFLGLATPVISSPSTTGTNFYYAVTATNPQGETVISNVLAMNTSTSVINWTQVPGATGYKIYRNSSNAFTSGSLLLTTIINGTTVAYTDTGSATGAGLPPTAPAGTKLVVQAWAGSGGNLIEAQNASGTAFFRATNAGDIVSTGQNNTLTGLLIAPSYGGHTGNKLMIQTSGATVGAVIQGGSSQSGDLLDLQDNSGNINASINSVGNQLTLGRIAASGTVTQGALVLADGTTDGFGATLNTSTLTASRTISLPDAAGTVCLQGATACGFAPATGGTGYIQNQSASAQSANFYIQSASANAIGGLVQGAVGQTASIFKALTSTGVGLDVQSGGTVNIGTSLTVFGNNAVAKLGVRNSSQPAINVQSQGTGDAFQTTDLNGVVFSKVDSNGALATYGASNQFLGLATPAFTAASTGTSFYYCITAINAAGETACSSSLGMANNTSAITWGQVAGATSYKIYRNTSNAFTAGSLLLTTISNGTTVTFTDTGTATAAGLPPTTPTGTALTVQSWQGQTASPLVVQNAGGTNLFQVASSGDVGVGKSLFVGNNASGIGANGELEIITTGTTRVGEVIRSGASQTADLFQLQDSSNNTITNFDAAGYLHVARAAATTDNVLAVRLAGDTNDRFTLGADGKLSWGPGNGASDVTLSRNAVGSLAVAGAFGTTGSVTVGTSGGNLACGSACRAFIGTNSDYSAYLNVGGSTASRQRLVLQGAASQTADLLQFQATNGEVLSATNANGALITHGTNNQFLALATPTFTTSSTGTSFYYCITATNAVGETICSSGLGMTNNTSTLNWNQVSGATGYKLYRNTSNSFTAGSLLLTTITNGTTVSFTDTGAATGAGLPPTVSPAAGALVVQSWQGASGAQGSPLVVKNSTGSVTNFFSPSNGYLYGNGLANLSTVNNATVQTQNTGTLIATATAGNSALKVQNTAASPTADLFLLQDPTGNVNAAFGPTGAQLTLGRIAASGTVTQGALVFSDGTTDNFGATLNTSTLTANRTISLPDASGAICLVGSVSCSAAGTGYVQLAPSAAQVDSTTNSSIFINKTGASGNLLQLQNSGTDRLVVASGGQVGVMAPTSATAYLTVGVNGGTAISSNSLIRGLSLQPTISGTGDIQGVYSQPIANSTNTNLYSFYANQREAGASGMLTNSYGYYASMPTITAGGAITNAYGLYVESLKTTGVSTAYGIYQAGATDTNYFAGNVGINAAGANLLSVNTLTTAASTAQAAIATGGTNNMGLVIQGAPSQAVNLMEIQKSDGARQTYFDANGLLHITNILDTGGAGNTFNVGNTLRNTNNSNATAANIYSVGTGDALHIATGLNANLVAKMDNAGNLTTYGTNNTFAGLATPAFGANTSATTGGTLTTPNTYYYVITATNAQGETVASANASFTPTTTTSTYTLNWTQVNGTTGYKLYRNTSNSFTSGSLLLTTITNGTTVSFTDTGAATGAGLPPTSVTGTKLSVQGWSGQTGNVFEVLNGLGSVTAGYNANTANLFSNNALSVGSSTQLGGAYFSVRSLSGNVVGTILQGASGQTSDLLDLRDSSANVNAAFGPTGAQLTLGRIAASGTVTQGKLILSDGTTDDFGATLNTSTLTASRTISLPDEDGTVCLRSSSNCGFAAGAGSTSYVQNQSASAQAANFFIQSGASAGTTTALLRTASGQTGAVLDVQDLSTNSALQVAADGSITLNGGNQAHATTVDRTLLVDTGNSATIGLKLAGRAAQTADLAQFQDANGAVLSSFGAAGGLATNGVGNTFAGLATPAFTTSATGTTYYYELTATNAAGETVASASLGMANNTSTLNWDQVAGATGYKLYRNTDNNFTSAGAGGSSQLLTTISNGTTAGITDTGATTTAGLPPTTTAGTTTVFKAWQSQSSDLIQAQDSNGAVLAALDTAGNLTVKNLVVNGSLTVNGHLITGGSTPGIGAGAAACTSPTVGITGNDTSGTITITTGTGCSSGGTLATITFGVAYTATPRVLLTPGDGPSAQLLPYRGASTANFTVGAVSTPTDATTYTFDYHIEQ